MTERLEPSDGFEDYEGRLGGYAFAYDEVVGLAHTGEARTAVLAALRVGPVAGVVMLLILSALHGTLGLGFWYPLGLIAEPFLGPAASLHGAKAVLVGLIAALAISTVLAILYAALLVLLVGHAPRRAALTTGALYGLSVWLVVEHVILPVTYPTLATSLSPWALFISCMAYGLMLSRVPTGCRLPHEQA